MGLFQDIFKIFIPLVLFAVVFVVTTSPLESFLPIGLQDFIPGFLHQKPILKYLLEHFDLFIGLFAASAMIYVLMKYA